MFPLHLPVHPNLVQLKHQAKDLIRSIRRGDLDAIATLQQHLPQRVVPANVSSPIPFRSPDPMA